MARFAADELAELAFTSPPPDASKLARKWRLAVDKAQRIVEALPTDEVGTCVLLGEDQCRFTPEELPAALERQQLRFRTGSIRSAMPTIRPSSPS